MPRSNLHREDITVICVFESRISSWVCHAPLVPRTAEHSSMHPPYRFKTYQVIHKGNTLRITAKRIPDKWRPEIPHRVPTLTELPHMWLPCPLCSYSIVLATTRCPRSLRYTATQLLFRTFCGLSWTQCLLPNISTSSNPFAPVVVCRSV